MRKKLVSAIVLAAFLFAIVPMGTIVHEAEAMSDRPSECFAPNYASWATFYCDMMVLCFVLYACSVTPAPDTQSVTPIDDSPSPRNAKQLDQGDADGVSG